MKGCTWYGCDLSTKVSGANVGRSQKGFSLNALPGSSIRFPPDRMGFVQELAAIDVADRSKLFSIGAIRDIPPPSLAAKPELRRGVFLL